MARAAPDSPRIRLSRTHYQNLSQVRPVDRVLKTEVQLHLKIEALIQQSGRCLRQRQHTFALRKAEEGPIPLCFKTVIAEDRGFKLRAFG